VETGFGMLLSFLRGVSLRSFTFFPPQMFGFLTAPMPSPATNKRRHRIVKLQVSAGEVSAHFVSKDWDKAPVSVEKIRDLVLDWRLYPRQQVDHIVVDNYARSLRAGANFPPVKVGILAGRKIIVDGVHRIRSREQLQIDYADCATLHFHTVAEVFGEAVRLNSSHGKGFCEAEFKANIRRLQRYKFDVKDIVTICHVPASEITRETIRPIISVTLPSGKKLSCTAVKPGEAGVHGLICLKNALMIVCNWAELGKIPEEPPFKELVARARVALGRVRFNVD
jgi:hypothetical protein